MSGDEDGFLIAISNLQSQGKSAEDVRDIFEDCMAVYYPGAEE